MAMQVADAQTVLGKVASVTFKGENETTRFFRQGQALWVRAIAGGPAPTEKARNGPSIMGDPPHS